MFYFNEHQKQCTSASERLSRMTHQRQNTKTQLGYHNSTDNRQNANLFYPQSGVLLSIQKVETLLVFFNLNNPQPQDLHIKCKVQNLNTDKKISEANNTVLLGRSLSLKG